MALGGQLLDAATFTSIRVISGAATLVILTLAARPRQPFPRPDIAMCAGLLAYMAGFSFAYRTLDTGTGALILFAVVQLTMFVVAMRGGETFSRQAWFGVLLAAAGLIWQLAPGATAPNMTGALLMIAAGMGWATYTLRGRASTSPLGTTAVNFLCIVPFVLALSLSVGLPREVDPTGLSLAITSGVLTSGIGYAVWYAVLPSLRATTAATVQLAVPALAAFAGVLLLNESVTLRLIASSVLTLGGILIVVLARSGTKR